MINKEITNKILFVGPASKNDKAGISTILETYQSLCETFKCISTYEKINGKVSYSVYFKAYIPLIRYLFSQNIRIVHIHGASNGSFWRKAPIILLAHIFRKKIIFHCHGGGFKDFYNTHPRIISYILKKCDTICALSSSWKIFFEREIGCKKVCVIPNVIDKPNDSIIHREYHGVCNILFLGKICKDKGVYDLITTIGENQNFFRGKIKLYLGGNGFIDKMNTFINKFNINDMIEYVGYVSGQKKKELFHQCHIFILPSYYEGIPLSILEAMSYHMPIIATNVGGIPEIVEDGKEGILIQPRNQEQILQTITYILSIREKWEEIGNNGYIRSSNHFPNRVKNILQNLYISLLNN